MGALRRAFLTEYWQTWRLFTFPVLHAGAIHLLINLCSMILVGIHLEKLFGPRKVYCLIKCLILIKLKQAEILQFDYNAKFNNTNY